MDISVIGAGYVGLVTATCLADVGNNVICAKKTKKNLETLKKGVSPIYEVGLNEILQKNVKNGNLRFTNNLTEALDFSDVIFICVGTPQSDDGEADLSQVTEVTEAIAKKMGKYKLIIEKSTVPVNTHQKIKKIIHDHNFEAVEFDVASNPEFLREGTSVHDFMNPQRIVIGIETERAKRILKEIYKPFTDKGHKLLITSPASAEIIKYASNSFLAMKISYINMIADLCEKTGANIDDVAEGIGLDSRIGKQFLNAGLGYGGSCLPKDVSAFIKTASDYGLDFDILKETKKINSTRPVRLLNKLKKSLKEIEGKQITIWGLSFKPNTEDTRDSPAIAIVKNLQEEGAILKLYDPMAEENFRGIFPETATTIYHEDKYEALKNSDALIIITDWHEFKTTDLDKVKLLKEPFLIVDGRNTLNPKTMKDNGFDYYRIGR